jgi:hypothetical protein
MAALLDIYRLVPALSDIPMLNGIRTVNGEMYDRARDRVLLGTDAFFFEFRAYLELLARFTHGVLTAIGKGPVGTQLLSTGEKVQITTKTGNFRAHQFLLYISDKLGVSPDWYKFLSDHRNFFTHRGAPYCAIEDRLFVPRELDLLIMKANIHDFAEANPSDYFRVSDCQAVVDGMRKLSAAIQQYLIEILN